MNVVRNFCSRKETSFFKSCYWKHYTITVVTEREGYAPFWANLNALAWPKNVWSQTWLKFAHYICFRAAFSVLKGIFSYLHFKIDEALHWRSSSLYLKMIYANDLCLVEISFVFLLKNLFSKVTKVLSVFIYLFVIIFPGREFGWNWFSDFRLEY